MQAAGEARVEKKRGKAILWIALSLVLILGGGAIWFFISDGGLDGDPYTMTAEPAFVFFHEVEYPFDDMVEALYFQDPDEGMFTVWRIEPGMQHGEMRIIDVNGREIMSSDEYFPIYSAGDGLFLTRDFSGQRLVDAGGREITSFDVEQFVEPVGDGFFRQQGRFFGDPDILVDQSGRELADILRYAPGESVSSATARDGFFAIRTFGIASGTWYDGVVDIDGRVIFPFESIFSRRVLPVGDGLFIMSIYEVGAGTEWSLVDIDGREIIPTGTYDGIQGVHGRFAVMRDEEMGVIDIDGDEIIPFGRYAAILVVRGGALVLCPTTELWGIIRFN